MDRKMESASLIIQRKKMDIQNIKVVQIGLGQIGQECIKIMLNRPKLELRGAIDIDPKKVGKDIGELLDLKKESGIVISDDADKILKETKADVVLLTTSSSLKAIYPQLEMIIKNGANVVSSAEESVFPKLQNLDLAKKIDKMARDNGVTALGTGVNPGFVMDTLVLVLTAVCESVQRIRVERFLDARHRRRVLQEKVGAGMTLNEFRRKIEAGTIGHIGILESVSLIAYGLSWELDRVEENLDPIISDQDYKTQYFEIKKGNVCGIKNVGHGFIKRKEVITLDLRMYVGCREPKDVISLKGNPEIKLVIQDGIPGDVATSAMLVNSIESIIKTTPGLKTMADLVIPRIF